MSKRRVLERPLVLSGLALILVASPLRPNKLLTSAGFDLQALIPIWYGVMIAVLASRRTYSLVFRVDKFFLGLTVLAACSYAWTDSAGLTLFGSLELISVIVLSAAAVNAFGSPARAILAVGALFVAGGMLSWMVALAFPDLAWDSNGQWRGIHNHKSHLGLYASIPILILFSGISAKKSDILVFLVLLTCLPLLVLSRCVSAVAALCAAFLMVDIFANRTDASMARKATLAAVLFVALVLTIRPDHFARLDRYLLTLNGRVQKWKAVVSSVHSRTDGSDPGSSARALLLGAGYDSFWADKARSRAVLRSARLSVRDPKQYFTDNGILDVYACLGLPGLALLLASIGSNASRAFRSRSDPFALWAIGFLSYALAFNMLYNGFLNPRSPLLPFYVMTAIGLAERQPSRNRFGTDAPRSSS